MGLCEVATVSEMKNARRCYRRSSGAGRNFVRATVKNVDVFYIRFLVSVFLFLFFHSLFTIFSSLFSQIFGSIHKFLIRGWRRESKKRKIKKLYIRFIPVRRTLKLSSNRMHSKILWLNFFLSHSGRSNRSFNHSAMYSFSRHERSTRIACDCFHFLRPLTPV